MAGPSYCKFWPNPPSPQTPPPPDALMMELEMTTTRIEAYPADNAKTAWQGMADRIEAAGAKLVGTVLMLYGLAVMVEIVRSYVLN